MSHDSAPYRPEQSAPITVGFERLLQLSGLLVPAEIINAPAISERITLELGANAITVSVELLTGPAAAGSYAASEDGREDTLAIDVLSQGRTTRLYGNRMDMPQLIAEMDFKAVVRAMQAQHPEETAWVCRALGVLQAPGATFIEALARLRREPPVNSDVFSHQASSQRAIWQQFTNGTSVSGVYSKNWYEASLHDLEDGNIRATVESKNKNFSVEYEGGAVQRLERHTLYPSGELKISEDGLRNKVVASAVLDDLEATLKTAHESGVVK